MVTLLKNRICFFLLFCIITFSLYGQESYNSYSIVNVDSLSIHSFEYGDGINKCKEIFGEPENYTEYDESGGLGPEGIDKTIYVEYDSLNISFFEFQNKTFLNSISIRTTEYELTLGNKKIKIGDSLGLLATEFPKSYEFYKKQHPKPYKRKQQKFYISLKITHPDYIYYGLINIRLQNDVIKEIIISFDNGT